MSNRRPHDTRVGIEWFVENKKGLRIECSSHYQPRRPPLREPAFQSRFAATDVFADQGTGSRRHCVVGASRPIGGPERVAFAVDPSVEFEIIVVKLHPAGRALEAFVVEFLRTAPGHVVGLEVLALNALAATGAESIVDDVVVVCAVWVVVMHVEIRGGKRFLARLAHKAFFVVPPRQSSVSTGH